jgi:uncharacterized protein (TIGR03437 family)
VFSSPFVVIFLNELEKGGSMTSLGAQHLLKQRFVFILCVIIAALIAGGVVDRWPTYGQSGNQLAMVSAASFEDAIAPESIVAAFGVGLATRVEVAPAVPLPTELAGTTVKVKDNAGVERDAQLFFVSPGQVNFLVPASTAVGQAIVTIRSGDGTISTGEMKVNEVAPSLFTANGDGKGVPAAVLLRVRADGTQIFEKIAECDPRPCVAKPIDLSPAGERVFLLLYGTGLRRSGQTIRVLLGGGEEAAVYAPVTGLDGLDQINVVLPPALIGRGVVSLAVTAIGFSTSNRAEIEIAPPPGIGPTVFNFDPGFAVARQTLMIQGENFDPERDKNLVIIGGRESRDVEMASPTQLSVKVPFGAASGKVAVRTSRGQGVSLNDLRLPTAISGFVRTTAGQPLPGVVVQQANSTIKIETDKEGAFVLPNVTPHNALVVDIIPPPALPYPQLRLKQLVERDRDNHMGKIELQQIQSTGQNVLPFSLSGPPAAAALRSKSQAVAAAVRVIQDSGVTFEIADNATANFPGGGTIGAIFLNLVERSRTPAELPPGVFSSTIAQLTPFGVKLTPGGKLIFPNNDRLPANSLPRLYRFDQTPGSPTLGAFVEAGMATISPDGQRIETAPTAITETSIFFVASPRPATTVIGRVLESDGAPVRGAIARTNGQEAITDGNGGFTLRNVNVPVNTTRLVVEASFQRPNGRVDRAQSADTPVVLNGVTNVGVLTLPPLPPNRPPVIVAPSSLEVTEGLVLQASVLAYDPDSNMPLQVRLTGPGFASLNADGNNANTYTLRLAPPAGSAQSYALTITATDVDGASVSHSIQLTVRANRAPSVTAPSLFFVTPGQPLSFIISATDLDNTPPGIVAPQTFTFSSPNLPPGATLTPQAGGTSARFDWTPNSTGTFTPSFTARDNGSPPLTSAAKSTTIVVGLPWEQTGTAQMSGIEAAQTFALLFVGSDLFVATSGGVFRSTDQGQSWVARNGGLTTLHVNTLVRSGATLLAGTNGGGVFRSNDDGQNWTNCGGLPNGVVRALAVSSRGLFAGAFGGGVFLSTDGCQNWTPINSGLGNPNINALTVSDSTLYAGTEGGGVFRLNDNEQTWQSINAGLTNLKVRAIAASSSTLFAGTDGGGVFCSTNRGQSWANCSNGLTNLTINALVVNGSEVFASTSGSGVFRSTNQGGSWAPLGNNGLKNPFVSCFAIGSSNTYFAGTAGGGVFRSMDQGQNWEMASSGLVTSTINALIVSGSTLYAGTAGGGVFSSTNQGQSWVANSAGLTAPYVNAFAVAGGNLFAATNGGVFFTPLSAPLSWTAANNGLPGARYAIPLIAVGSALYVGIAPDGGVYRSDDLGQNWRSVNNGLADRNIQSLTSLGSTLLAGTENGGVFRSTDGGQNWAPANTGLTGLRVHALAAGGSDFYAGTNNGVHRSTDQGQSWTPVNVGLPDRAFVNALLLSGSNLYAGIFGGLYFSNDQGQNWVAANAGLTHVNVFSLARTASNLFAGTIGGGVYRNPSLE